MEELVFKGTNDQVLTNSLLVAEKFEKNHRDVLEAVRTIIRNAENSAVLSMFCESTYLNQQNKEQPMYVMNRDGFTLLAMGFTGVKALQFKMDFITAFNKMESMLKSDDYILMRSQQILQKRIEIAEQKAIMLQAQNEQLTETVTIQSTKLKQAAPKVEYFDKALSSTGTFTATQIAKEFGWGAETLNRKLKELGVQYKQNGQWILYAKYDGKEYTRSIPRTFTKSDGTTGSQMQTVWTEKGRLFVHQLLKGGKSC